MLNIVLNLVLLSFFLIKVDINSLTIPTFTANFVENCKKSFQNVLQQSFWERFLSIELYTNSRFDFGDLKIQLWIQY